MFSSLLLTTFLAAVIGVQPQPYETIPNRTCLRSMSGMMDSMFSLAANHTNLMTITDIGDSWLKTNPDASRPIPGYDMPPAGGYDIYALNITLSNSTRTSEEKGKMFITAGVHAREYAPPELLARFIEMLVHGYNDDADITWILEHNEIHAILYANPDGRFIAEKYPELYWRKNLNPNGNCDEDDSYGVDINRNFDILWGDTTDWASSNHSCDSDYHGPSGPESEPETQAIANYARSLFPVSQRKTDINVPFGEDVMGMYIDIHASGGYVYYPWGHKNETSPDDDALQALGRKMHHFNKYLLWAGGQKDFVYPASGDASDWHYAALGVASMGFEIGDDFYQECDAFENGENSVVAINLPALLFAAKTVQKPFSTIKGPDILDLDARHAYGQFRVYAQVSDSKMVNTISDFPDFHTGNQTISTVHLYRDVHPDDYDASSGDVRWEMQYVNTNPDPDEDTFVFAIDSFTPGRHHLFAQATDSDGYKGPVSSVFLDVSGNERKLRGARRASLRGSRAS